MINPSFCWKKVFQRISLVQIKKISVSTAPHFRLKYLTCLCGNSYLRSHQIRGVPLQGFVGVQRYSTQNDQVCRQKVIIEATSPPKLHLDETEQRQTSDESKIVPKIHDRRRWREIVDPYIKLARWDRPIGVYLLYWPCSWSIALATLEASVPLQTSLQMAGLFLVGAGLMRGAGCTINDMWDKDIDRQVERTRDRPLVSGALSTRQAWSFLAVQLSAALLVLLQLNWYSVVLGASSMLLVASYPLAKRWTRYPQVFLGATFNWGALLGYTALAGHLRPDAPCVPLYLAALAWTVLYDTIYAHQDKLDDARIGVMSTALTFGAHTKPALCACLCVFTGGLCASGVLAHLASCYYLAVGGVAAHVASQIYTLDTDNPSDCADKFRSNAWVGLVVLLGILGGGYARYNVRDETAAPHRDISVGAAPT